MVKSLGTTPHEGKALRNDMGSSDCVILDLIFIAHRKQSSGQLNNIDFLLVARKSF